LLAGNEPDFRKSSSDILVRTISAVIVNHDYLVVPAMLADGFKKRRERLFQHAL
jgi:hypothetical protein